MQCGQSALQFAQHLKDDRKVSEAMYNLGQVFVMTDKVSAAMSLINEATDVCGRTRDEVMEAHFRCLLAQLHLQQGELEHAKLPIKQAIDIFKHHKNQNGEKIARELL